MVNKNLNSIGEYNAIDSHPVIIIYENYYFLPISFNLARSIYESPFYWMRNDKQYKDMAFKNRGEATERIASELLETVFKKGNVHKNVRIYKNKKELTDIDVLAIAGNKAVIIQAKSKKLTELSRKGDDLKLREDFKKAVQDAYDQGLDSRSAVIDKTNILVLENGEKLKLGEFIDDAYIICLTTDNYPAVTQQVDVYLQKKEEDPYPLAMSIFDLDIVTYYLKDPFDLLYYLRQRVNLCKYYKATSEMAFLGYHLNKKLFPQPGVDKEIVEEGFAQLIDANFPAMKGYHPITDAVEKLYHKWKNEKFQLLIEQLKNTGIPGFTDALFFLYDLSGDAADKLINLIEQTKQKNLKDKKMYDFPMIFEKGKYGVSFISISSSPEKLDENLMNLCVARKYKTRADVWLGLGWITNSPKVIDEIVFDKQHWSEDRNLEDFSKIMLKTGMIINKFGKKVGRNDPCPCGSGKKFKKCCGK